MICAPNGGYPDILIVKCPHCLSMMWKEKWLTNAAFFSRLVMTPPLERCTSQTVALARATSTMNTPARPHGSADTPRRSRVCVPGLAVDDRHLVHLRPRSHPAGEPSGDPLQMCIVQQLITAVVQGPPPVPEPARIVAQREEGVEPDPVHAVVATG